MKHILAPRKRYYRQSVDEARMQRMWSQARLDASPTEPFNMDNVA